MAKPSKRILMIAAENGALPGGKVGGMGDVVRDIPVALCQLGHKVDVLMPGYQYFSRQAGAKQVAEIEVEFRGEPETLLLFKLPSRRATPGLQTWVIDHPMLAPLGAGKIYCDDSADHPFATDASKFALFCIAAAQAITDGEFVELDVIHLHDWHTALIAVLAHYHASYKSLQSTPLVYTIHNLSLQGIRPFSWDDSALENWYRDLQFDYATIKDPLFDNCYNPMRAAINLCDKVHAVSPTYVTEIQRPSAPEQGFVGGEGLESDLQMAAKQKRLLGILNGCEYFSDQALAPSQVRCVALIKTQLTKWQKSELNRPSHKTAHANLTAWSLARNRGPAESNARLLTSVGRISDQKVRILLTQMADGRTALEHTLDQLSTLDLFILLGSGDSGYETLLERIATENNNFIFIRGYSDRLAELLYMCGDLFIMPSSFEPCGISQMLAMRAGQPCLVHHVGGLVDTVRDGVDGFAFIGKSPLEQAQNMIKRVQEVLAMNAEQPEEWQNIKHSAFRARFHWAEVAEEYIDKLYLEKPQVVGQLTKTAN